MEAFAHSDGAGAGGAASVYFWFDLFVNDQHEAVSLPQLWWRGGFLSPPCDRAP